MSDNSTARPRNAMILAAGLGTRMRPLTNAVPKPMVELAGKPLIDHVLERCDQAGITKAIVNVHYCADVLQRYLADRQRPQIIISDERDEVLDTGGGVAKALGLLGSEPFMIHNSDSVWTEARQERDNEATITSDAAPSHVSSHVSSVVTARDPRDNLDRLLDAWDARKMDCLLMLAPCNTSLGYDGKGDFVMANDGRLMRRAQLDVLASGTANKAEPYVFAGVSIIHPRLFGGAPAGRFSLNILWNKAIETGRLYGICATGVWMHVGDPAALELASRHLASVTASGK